QAKAVRQRPRLGRLGQLVRMEAERALRPRESITRKGCTRLSVVLERGHRACLRFVQDRVQKVEMFAVDVVLEDPTVALQPRPRDDAPTVLPETERPLRLAALVLSQSPRDVADVPRRA